MTTEHIEEHCGTDKCPFTVTGEFLTDLSRTLWADEGEPEKALRILEAAFPEMSKSTMFEVLVGKQRLDGDSNAGITLQPDDEPVSQHGNERALEAVLRKFRDQADEGEDWKQMATGQTRIVPSPKGRVEVPVRRTRNNRLNADLVNIPYREADAEVLRKKFYDTDTNRQRCEQGIEEAESPSPPKPKRSITTATGWLSPGGKFYPCAYGCHHEVAFRLGYREPMLEKLGWVKLQNGNFFWDFTTHFEPTQRQIDLVFDYCRENHLPLPRVFGGKDEDGHSTDDFVGDYRS